MLHERWIQKGIWISFMLISCITFGDPRALDHIPNGVIPTLGKLMSTSKVDCLVTQCDLTWGKPTKKLYKRCIFGANER